MFFAIFTLASATLYTFGGLIANSGVSLQECHIENRYTPAKVETNCVNIGRFVKCDSQTIPEHWDEVNACEYTTDGKTMIVYFIFAGILTLCSILSLIACSQEPEIIEVSPQKDIEK